MSPENQLKKDVMEYLRDANVAHFRMNSGTVKVRGGFMKLCPPGTADILIFQGTRIKWCELKAEGQTTAKEQKQAQDAFREKFLAMGHNHAVCRSVDDVVKFLEAA